MSMLRLLRACRAQAFMWVPVRAGVVSFWSGYVIAFALAVPAAAIAGEPKAVAAEARAVAFAPAASGFKLDAHEEVVFVKVPGTSGVLLETTIFRPPGPGPFPLVVMNHGKAATRPSSQMRARYPVLSREFLRRGYAVVLPMRQGFSRSGGAYGDGACDLAVNGRTQAGDVAATVLHFQQQGWVDSRHVMVIGQSHGGLVSMAYGELAAPGVRLIVNFAGGLRANGGRCQKDWQQQMLRAFERFGSVARVPSVWFYGANDSYFSPEFSGQLLRQFDAGRAMATNRQMAAGAPARLVNTPAFGQDSHGMVEYTGAIPLWWPELEREMRRYGMPVPSVAKPAANPSVRSSSSKF